MYLQCAVGAHRERETPVPIPNTAVKPPIGYYTWPIKAWENSTVPYYRTNRPSKGGFSLRKPCAAHSAPLRGE